MTPKNGRGKEKDRRNKGPIREQTLSVLFRSKPSGQSYGSIIGQLLLCPATTVLFHPTPSSISLSHPFSRKTLVHLLVVVCRTRSLALYRQHLLNLDFRKYRIKKMSTNRKSADLSDNSSPSSTPTSQLLVRDFEFFEQKLIKSYIGETYRKPLLRLPKSYPERSQRNTRYEPLQYFLDFLDSPGRLPKLIDCHPMFKPAVLM